MHTDLSDLLQLLDLTELEPDLYQGEGRNIVGPRIFGGQVLGQALRAACHSVPGRTAHSLQSYFLRPGDAREAIIYRVERVRDGQTFSTRRVVAEQRGRPIFDLSASFTLPAEGPSHQCDAPVPEGPDGLLTEQELNRQYLEQEDISENFRNAMLRRKPLEMRPVVKRHPLRPEPAPPLRQVWMRAPETLPEDPVLHQCILAYVSDHSLMGTAMLPHGLSFLTRDHQMASLDHALWFHRPVNINDWLFYQSDSPIAADGRGFNRGQIFNQQGELVASVAQEGLMRKM
ncbi:Acyl-CoA thioesterase II [Alloalcanivorax dieselolei B5]|uniref:Acyl-CoA thioesterase 2 n=1 Tax=Alcanivorax dieselolei (strain DSM 16502 / CGMCC 1.3690 / MCCC 1A00001 / B-5) TaxID=930169 RepID=K0CDP5_ALCDB|nr:acyl-CoA thioesterase II [Alloalcanivorax dieselolei]AFT69742.1 Acyl-CoA thioesterase II [Alloalcanivorax dieselolei B5]GGJ86668.1 acyl-CoA thioesterase II [Alloalcanivorax dieselolei]